MQILHNPTAQPDIWKPTLAVGVLSVVIGVVMLFWPAASLVVAATFFGAYLVITGLAQVVMAFGLPLSSAANRVLMFISGAASLILAVMCFRNLANSILLLAIWIGIGFIFRGVAGAVTALTTEGLPSRGWVLVAGVITIVAGFVVLGYPFTSLATLVMVVAAWLIVLGVVEMSAAVRLRSRARRDQAIGARDAALPS